MIIGTNFPSSSIVDMNGVKYFDLQPAGLEDDAMMLTDTKGREVSPLHCAAAVQLYINAEI